MTTLGISASVLTLRQPVGYVTELSINDVNVPKDLRKHLPGNRYVLPPSILYEITGHRQKTGTVGHDAVAGCCAVVPARVRSRIANSGPRASSSCLKYTQVSIEL